MKRVAAILAALGFVLLGAGYAYDSRWAPLATSAAPERAAEAARHLALAAWLGRAGIALLVAGAGLAMVQAGVRRLRGPRR